MRPWRILTVRTMPQDRKLPTPDDARICPWCEKQYRTPPGHTGSVCPECRAELMEQPKEVLVDMLGRVAGVNVITMASLSLHAPDSLDALGLWDSPKREGFTQRPVTMKAFTRKQRRVH